MKEDGNAGYGNFGAPGVYSPARSNNHDRGQLASEYVSTICHGFLSPETRINHRGPYKFVK